MSRQLLFVFLFLFPICSFAQNITDSINLSYQSTLFGVGSARVYDTYISPLEYSGTTLALLHERMKQTGASSRNLAGQHFLKLDFSKTSNEKQTASGYSGFISYSYGLFHKFKPINKFQFFAGPQVNTVIGAIYNSRNGNNPVAAKAMVNLGASAIAAYNFQIKSQPLRVRYQTSVPVVGGLFSPDYGQSYYEIGLMKNSNKLVHFASLHNQLAMRNSFSVEVPFNAVTIQVSYSNSIYESSVNDLQTKIRSNIFFFGISRNFFTVPGNKPLPKNFKPVFN